MNPRPNSYTLATDFDVAVGRADVLMFELVTQRLQQARVSRFASAYSSRAKIRNDDAPPPQGFQIIVPRGAFAASTSDAIVAGRTVPLKRYAEVAAPELASDVNVWFSCS